MRRQQRVVADEWLLWGAVPRESSELLAFRARELTSTRNREALARRGVDHSSVRHARTNLAPRSPRHFARSTRTRHPRSGRAYWCGGWSSGALLKSR